MAFVRISATIVIIPHTTRPKPINEVIAVAPLYGLNINEKPKIMTAIDTIFEKIPRSDAKNEDMPYNKTEIPIKNGRNESKNLGCISKAEAKIKYIIPEIKSRGLPKVCLLSAM